MAEQIEALFKLETLGNPRNIVLDEGPHPHGTRRFNAAFAKSLWSVVY